MPTKFQNSQNSQKKSQNLYEDSAHVVELDPSDFIRLENGAVGVNNYQANNKHGFVMFYADWCNYCKNMVNIWNELADFFGEDIFIGAFNCANKSSPHYSKIAKLANVQYYPTFKFMSLNSSLSPYDKGRKKEDFLRFLCDHTSKFCGQV